MAKTVETASLTTQNGRNSTFELIRVISMLMVVMLHILGKGGPLQLARGASNYSVSWMIEAFCACSTNVFIMISGYFIVETKFKPKKFLLLWLQIFFYSAGIALLIWSLNLKAYDKKDLRGAFGPITSLETWYVTYYFAIYTLSPFLRKGLTALSKKQYKMLVVALLMWLCIWPSVITKQVTLDNGHGYSFMWLLCMFIVGGYLRLHFKPKFNRWIYLAVYVASCLLSWKICGYLAANKTVFKLSTSYYLNTNTITVVIPSVALFVFLSTIKIKNKVFAKVIGFFAPLTFGVYLIHEHHMMRKILWTNILGKYYYPIFHLSTPFTKAKMPTFLGILFLTMLLIFIACALIEFLRQLLFLPLTKSKQLDKLSNKLVRLCCDDYPQKTEQKPTEAVPANEQETPQPTETEIAIGQPHTEAASGNVCE